MYVLGPVHHLYMYHIDIDIVALGSHDTATCVAYTSESLVYTL